MGGSRGRLIESDNRIHAVAITKEANGAGARKREACKVLGISNRTLERWQKQDGLIDLRKGANKIVANKLSIEERNMIIERMNNSEYMDLPVSKIVPKLADQGIYLASESTIYRILRKEKLLAHRQKARPKTHYKPKECVAHKPNKVWSWDISYLPTDITGFFFYLYIMMDIYSRKIVGWHIHERESGNYAARILKQACLDEGIVKDQITLHSDNGKPMKSMSMKAMFEELGIIPSYSRPSVSDDNPYSEALFRTVKYHPTFPAIKRFSSIEEARLWMIKFADWYNDEHLHSGLNFVTPNQRHLGKDKEIFDIRTGVYETAKALNPARWSKNIRHWHLPEIITLNPDKKGDKLRRELAGKLIAA